MPESKAFQEWSLKVLEELTILNQRTEQLGKDLLEKTNSVSKEVEKTKAELVEKIDSINEVLIGNGNPDKGLLIRVDRLEQNEQRRTWALRATIVSCIGAIVASVFHWLKG